MRVPKRVLTWMGCAASGLALVSLAHAGNVVGTVKYGGSASAPEKLKVTKDTHVCAKSPKVMEALLVGANKGLQNVVVSVQGVPGAKPPSEKATLDQKGCHFNPHVTIVGVGATLEILNNDGILHNLHTWSKINRSFNKAQPKFRKVMREIFSKPEMFRISCDAHNWMEAWIVVADSPYYALTDAEGNFAIQDVPSGTYEVRYWHEKLGEQTQKVTVAASGDARSDLDFPPK